MDFLEAAAQAAASDGYVLGGWGQRRLSAPSHTLAGRALPPTRGINTHRNTCVCAPRGMGKDAGCRIVCMGKSLFMGGGRGGCSLSVDGVPWAVQQYHLPQTPPRVGPQQGP